MTDNEQRGEPVGHAVEERLRKDLQLVVSVEEMARRFRTSPEDGYGAVTVSEHPDALEAAKQFCHHRPYFPCSECFGTSMLAVVPCLVRIDRLEEELRKLRYEYDIRAQACLESGHDHA